MLREQETEESAVRALDELAFVTNLLEHTWGVRVCLDFSLVSDMNYYNGLMFRGFVRGIPSSVLSGGQYDNLMKRMGKTSRAIGFAVYLDQLERMEEERGVDADVLLLYGASDDTAQVLKRAEELRAQGKRVAVQREIPEKFHYGELHRFVPTEEGGARNG
jgi:ATP phosphoribosyltransferase regulatory subunit